MKAFVVSGSSIDWEEHLEPPHERGAGGGFTTQVSHQAANDHLSDALATQDGLQVCFVESVVLGFYDHNPHCLIEIGDDLTVRILRRDQFRPPLGHHRSILGGIQMAGEYDRQTFRGIDAG